jgi:hypothetical protein
MSFPAPGREIERRRTVETFEPGPDGNASDNWNSDPREDRGDEAVAMAIVDSHVKRSIRSTF